MFLGLDSMPVPGPDGRIVCEVYEFPFIYDEHYHSISLAPSLGMIYVSLVDHAPILYAIPKEPIKALQWLLATAPFVKEVIPKRYHYRIYSSRVMVISVTLDEWKRLQAVRSEGTTLCAYLYP